MKIVPPMAEVIEWTANPLALIEHAGRTCTATRSRCSEQSQARFTRSLIDRGHLSVLEHASATVFVVCDTGVSHELVRHRLASYSQESTRYVAYKEIEFVEPPFETLDQADLWCSAMEFAERQYLGLLTRGAAPEIARGVLPKSLKTEMDITANFREWLHILEAREAKEAHPQMRQIAGLIREQLHGVCPEIF